MKLFSMKEAASELGVSYATLQGQIFHGRVPAPALKIGPTKVFTLQEVEAIRDHLRCRDARAKAKADNKSKPAR